MSGWAFDEGDDVVEHIHDWETGSWGVIVGVSKCRVCGTVSRTEDFPLLARNSEASDSPEKTT